MKLSKVWIVVDPRPGLTPAETCYVWPVDKLPTLILGTGIPTWKAENTALHDSENSARFDYQQRLARYLKPPR